MMEDKNIIALWNEQSLKIDQSLALNRKLLRELINQKAHSALRSLSWLLSASAVAGMLWLLVLGILLSYAIMHYSHAADYFIVSFGAIFLLNLKAIYDYIKHLVLVNRIDYNASVMDIQKRLMNIQLSMIRSIKILFLQLPFWTTFFLRSTWFPQHTTWYWILIQITITGTFIYAACWIYKNLSLENMNNKIVKTLISSWDRKYILKASEFYKEVEDYQE